MTHIAAPARAGSAPFAALRARLQQFREERSRAAAVRATAAALSRLSDAELRDIGVARDQIGTAARRAVEGWAR